MIITRKVSFLVALLLILVIFCAVLWPSINRFITSFPEILMGQIVLTRETKPLSPRAYQSAELVLNQVALSEIEQGFFIKLHDDVQDWNPHYVGFPRTKLTLEEIQVLQPLLSAGNLFYPLPDGNSYKCVTRKPMQESMLETCPEGRHYMDQYVSFQWDAEQDHTVGVLQFYLTGGRLAEIRIYQSEGGLAYTPYEINGDWGLDGVTASLPLMEELAGRATIPPISILWPEVTAAQANERAARMIGNRYQPALEIIRNSSAVRATFGDIQEIRPAAGNNYYSSWMDSTSVFLTFRVIGTRGEGAAIIQGYDCFDLRMVFEGIPVDHGNFSLCP